MAPQVIVTGSSGFLGTHLVAALHKKNYEVTEWDKQYGADIFHNSLEQVIQHTDIVYHLAAITSVEQSFKVPEETYRVNTLGTARILYLCQKYKKKLIYPSSAAIYHPELSPYANSKKLAEDILKPFLQTVPVTILRLYNVFGPGMNPDSGSIMYNFMIANPLIVYGDGEQGRDYIHVRDVVDILMEAQNKEWNGKIVDIGTGVSVSVNYLAELFSHYRHISIEHELPRKEIRWSISDPTMRLILYPKPLTTDLVKDIKELCTPQ